MLRLVGTAFYKNALYGYFIWDESMSSVFLITTDALKQQLRDMIPFRNIKYESGKVSCMDCAVTKLPKYDLRGTALMRPSPMLILATKDSSFLVMNTTKFTTKYISYDAVRDLMRKNPNIIANAYLKEDTVVLKSREATPDLSSVKHIQAQVKQNSPKNSTTVSPVSKNQPAPVPEKKLVAPKPVHLYIEEDNLLGFERCLENAGLNPSNTVFISGEARLRELASLNKIKLPNDFDTLATKEGQRVCGLVAKPEFDEVMGIDANETVVVRWHNDILIWCERHNIQPSEFNQPVNLTECSPDDIPGLFQHMHSFNHPVSLPATAKSARALLKNCYLFNSAITLTDDIRDCSEMLRNCYYYNKPLELPRTCMNVQEMLRGCRAFDHPLALPGNVINAQGALCDCSSFNSHLRLSDNIQNCALLLKGCRRFNQPLKMPIRAKTAPYMLAYCTSFNSRLVLSDNLVNCERMLYFCESFNQPLKLSQHMLNCKEMLFHCTNFNQELVIPNKTFDCTSMLQHCMNFNQDISLPASVKCCDKMLYNIHDYDKVITISATTPPAGIESIVLPTCRAQIVRV